MSFVLPVSHGYPYPAPLGQELSGTEGMNTEGTAVTAELNWVDVLRKFCVYPASLYWKTFKRNDNFLILRYLFQG